MKKYIVIIGIIVSCSFIGCESFWKNFDEPSPRYNERVTTPSEEPTAIVSLPIKANSLTEFKLEKGEYEVDGQKCEVVYHTQGSGTSRIHFEYIHVPGCKYCKERTKKLLKEVLDSVKKGS